MPAVGEIGGLTLFAVLFGLDYIATVPPTAALVARQFGRRAVGLIFGWILLAHQVGAPLAAYAGGLAHQWLGDYTIAFLDAGVLAMIAALLSFQVGRGSVGQLAPV